MGQTPVSPASFDHHLSWDFAYAYLHGYLYLPNEGSYKSWVYHENFVSMYELEQKKKNSATLLTDWGVTNGQQG